MNFKLTLVCYFSTLSYCYILDGSCSPYADLITRGMKGAFRLAQAGSDIFQQPSTDPNVLEAQKDLTTYLFKETLQNPTEKATVVDRFTSVLSYNINNGFPEQTPDKDTYPQLTPDRLIFFCDYSRFEEDRSCDTSAEPGWVCDVLMWYQFPMTDVYTYCKTPTTQKHYAAWAFSLVNTYGLQQASSIQLCPWYLQQMQTAKYKTFADLGTGGTLAAFSSGVAQGVLAMDQAKLLDAMLLHEMTHAITTAEPTVDIDEDAGYGWSASVAFSDQLKTNNADSYALFGLGARMISPILPGAKAERPMKDGSVELIPSTKPERDVLIYRDLHPVKARYPNVTLTIDDTTVVLKPSDLAGFVISPSSTSPVTISSGRQYTIGTDVISLENFAIVEDSVTMSFPVVTTTTTSIAGGSSSYGGSSTLPSTFKISTLTSARNQLPSSLPLSNNTQSPLNTNGDASSSFSSGLSSESSLSSLTSSLEWISVNWSVSGTSTSIDGANTFSSSTPPSSISPSSLPGSATPTVLSKTGSINSTTFSSRSPGSILSSTNTTIYMSSTPISSPNNVNSSLVSSMTSPSSYFVTSSSSASSAQNNPSSSTPVWNISSPASSLSPIGTSSPSTSTLVSSQDASTESMSFGGTWTDIESTLTPASFTFVDIPTQTIVSAATETTDAVFVGSLFLALQANRKWLTDPKLRSQFFDDIKKTQEKTTALLNDLSVKPPETPDCHNTKRKRQTRMSEKQLRGILRDRSIIGSIGNVIKGAVHEIGTLINCASDVVQSLSDAVNKNTPDLGEIEDLTDTLAEIGQNLKDDGDDSENKSSATERSASTATSTSSLSSDFSSSSSTSSSSCSIQTASACDTSYSIFTPAGATTASTSTITLSCSTITACSASVTGSSTTASHSIVTVSLVGDDFGPLSWLIQQQSILSAMEADTTGIPVTWSNSEIQSMTTSTPSSFLKDTNSTATMLATSPISSSILNVSTSTLLATSEDSTLVITTQNSVSASESTSSSSQSPVTSVSSLSTTVPPTGPPPTTSALPCYNYAIAAEGVDFCSCSNGATTPVAEATGTNSGSAYQPCPWTIAPPLPTITTSPAAANTNPYPFTTTLLGGQVEICETATTSLVAGYTITLCAGSVITLSPSTTAPPPAYVTGVCNMHVVESTSSYPHRLHEDITINDGANSKLLEATFYDQWGNETTISSKDTKLFSDINLTWLERTASVNVRRALGESELGKRAVAESSDDQPAWMNFGVDISVGNTVWSTADTIDFSGGALPYCMMGNWADYSDSIFHSVSRSFDCYWGC